MDKKLLNEYISNKQLFRKAIRNCKTNKELYDFLLQVKNIKGYKLYVPNRWYIPVEDIVIFENGFIHCYFYMSGSRTYKTIYGISKVAELVKCSSDYDDFTLTYYNE